MVKTKRKGFMAVVMVLCMLAVLVMAVPAYAASGDVLMVVAGGNAGDDLIKARLESLGFTVTVKTTAEATVEDADGKVMIYISESVSSSEVTNKYTNSAVPILNTEPALWDDLFIADAGSSAAPDGGNAVIVNDSHSLAAGFTGTVQVTDGSGSQITFVAPKVGTVVMSLDGDESKACIFAVEKGDTLTDGSTAPEKRIGFFLHGTTAPTLTEDGWKLFDRAALYTAGALEEKLPTTGSSIPLIALYGAAGLLILGGIVIQVRKSAFAK